ncbi:MAG: thioredoxin domain-containing protein [Gammaproteobacteria bacterium]|nr:thioredoxin domain-containing protein [Gammaproteobacteria bacterium]
MRPIILLLISCFVLSLPGVIYAGAELQNQLKSHASPYLALHGEDPVHWQAWGPQAIDSARKSNKLMFISSGYFSCHWCHVMQRESYNNKAIARILNERFIPIKIDREMEPVLDEWLMIFIQETRGHGGWPLNVFLTPQGYPLAGVLYLPAEQFKDYLLKIDDIWNRDRQGLTQTAANAAWVMNKRQQMAQVLLPDIQPSELEQKLNSQTLAMADEMAGGFGQQTKFPLSPQLSALLTLYAKQSSEQMGDFLSLTLQQMADNGLYDRLGGGFYRYTVDPYWRTPHFEKMLYDNAQLVTVYLRAAEIFSRPEFENTAFSTLDFLLREMGAADRGGFVASLSAVDDQDREGAYYLWDRETLHEILSDQEYDIAIMAWGLDGTSELEYGHLPVKAMPMADLAGTTQKGPAQIAELLNAARIKMMTERQRRRLPKDDKRLSSWNGLVLSALAEAARRNHKRYAPPAIRLRNFILSELWDSGEMKRGVDKRGQSLGPGNLEDYAHVAKGLLAWAEFTGQKGDYRVVAEIATEAWRRFYTEQGWHSSETRLIPGQPPRHHIRDDTLPSPSAVLFQVSLEVLDQPTMVGFREKVLKGLSITSRDLVTVPFSYATHIALLSRRGKD